MYDEQFCSTGVKLAVTKVIAHELAHQVIYYSNYRVKMVSEIIFQITAKRIAPSESMMRKLKCEWSQTKLLRFRPQI